jgi:hypothetical protein
MAIVYMTTGVPGGPGSSSPDMPAPLPLLERRLVGRTCIYCGDAPPRIEPVTKYFTHVVILVTELDQPTDKFSKAGFYRISGLHAQDAAVLIAPQ